ncbi:hypothetical protein C8R45DRAFT_945882 [Mycena sanguinolenta]|nr:hypothetical protein C8R45DRAFT_945882 [Mycena sanguinolenta]
MAPADPIPPLTRSGQSFKCLPLASSIPAFMVVELHQPTFCFQAADNNTTQPRSRDSHLQFYSIKLGDFHRNTVEEKGRVRAGVNWGAVNALSNPPTRRPVHMMVQHPHSESASGLVSIGAPLTRSRISHDGATSALRVRVRLCPPGTDSGAAAIRDGVGIPAASRGCCALMMVVMTVVPRCGAAATGKLLASGNKPHSYTGGRLGATHRHGKMRETACLALPAYKDTLKRQILCEFWVILQVTNNGPQTSQRSQFGRLTDVVSLTQQLSALTPTVGHRAGTEPGTENPGRRLLLRPACALPYFWSLEGFPGLNG